MKEVNKIILVMKYLSKQIHQTLKELLRENKQIQFLKKRIDLTDFRKINQLKF